MTSAALLPTPGDPFLVKHWLVNYDRVWAGEVDTLHVLVTRNQDVACREYIRHEVEVRGGIYDERPEVSSHGVALNVLITDATEDVFVLMEDDVRVRTPGVMARCVLEVTSGAYDVVCGPRDSMTPNLQAAARERWGSRRLLDVSEGWGMWPAFVFARREDLLATNRDYGERCWNPGMVVPGLRYLMPEGEQGVADTFGSTAFQLRDRLEVLDLPQWKGPWHWDTWLRHYDEQMHWFHAGSLSSANNIYGPPNELVFMDGRTLTDPQEIGEWAHRLHWWQRCRRLHGHELPEVAERHAANWETIRERMGVPLEAIAAWSEVLDRMVTWDEA